MSKKDPAKVGGFKDLFEAELKWRLEHGDPEALAAVKAAGGNQHIFEVSAAGSAEAPRVISNTEDCVGLAFSGGGIRSATFNLGLLQGLHRLKILPNIDYLSTVSGGGYIGAWWSAWLARRDLDPKAESVFPEPRSAAPNSLPPEAEEIRHLREFSNFLAPRIGLFESETWAAVLAVVSAMLPALTVALSIVASALMLWLFGTAVMLPNRSIAAPACALALLAVVQVVCELRWWFAAKAEKCATGWWVGANVVALLVVGAVWKVLGDLWPMPQVADPRAAFGLLAQSAWDVDFSIDPHLFQTPIAWAGAAIALFAVRIVVLRLFRGDSFREGMAAIDRVLQRMLAAAFILALCGGLWVGGAYLNHIEWGKAPVAGGAVASGALFAMLRNWIATQLAAGKKAGPLDILKPLVPQLLAALAVALTAVCVAAGLAAGFESMGLRFFFPALAIAGGVILAAVFFFDPAMVSMHAFYRNRLARAYLGASNKKALQPDQGAVDNRFVDVRGEDDLPMRELLPQRSGLKRGPLHLVCCAANDVGGDKLGNLARASRSAVLSPLGFQINDSWRAWREEPGRSPTSIDRLTLSSAITASAAAFNSNMGSLSSELGTVVCFLMSALNLRLGLWLPHPGSGRDDLSPLAGGLFLKEMFGDTHSGLKKDGRPVSNYVHLSDGAHFENLAIYELVRRHCRYIILSDCGADPEVAFDDFGNAMRRIREDFGIEIDIDLSPLKPDPGSGLSRQHMVVGSIYYNAGRTDIGTLLYLKPSLTGDEPCDVTQYRTRNEQFPHESTGDQFYDEAQWESYRRLGSHAIQEALRFFERAAKASGTEIESDARAVFIGARQEWYPAPADLSEHVVEATERISGLEELLRGQNLPELMDELFPEIKEFANALAGRDGAAPENTTAAPAPRSLSKRLEDSLPVILELFRLMEAIWVSCYFDTHWNHPLNAGLFNLFQRWAYAPTSRLWWPFLRSLHGSAFRRFMEERLALRDPDYPAAVPRVNGPLDEIPPGLAYLHWCRSREDAPQPGAGERLRFYEYRLHLQLQQDGSRDLIGIDAQLGLAVIRHRGNVAQMRVDEFFVPPSLWGTGLGGVFIQELKKRLPPGVEGFEIVLQEERKRRRDRASREEHNDMLAFYKGSGFDFDPARETLVWRPRASADPARPA